MDELSAPTETFHKALPSLQLAWDSTSIGELKTCPRKYQYRILMGYVPRNTSPHLTFGLVYHAALEIYDHKKASGASHEEATISAVRLALERTWDGKLNRPWFSDIPEKNRETLTRTIIWYLEKFAVDPAQTIILANGKPAIELSFRFASGIQSNIANCDYLLCGHLDRLAEQDGLNWTLDRKTTKSALDKHYCDGYSPDNQMSLYSVAGSLILEKPVAGIIIDAAQIGVTFTRFQRFQISRTQRQLTEWMKDLEFWLGMAEVFAEKNYWPQNDKSCNQYRGCPYRKICSMPEGLRLPHLKANFNIEKWDPLIVRGDV